MPLSRSTKKSLASFLRASAQRVPGFILVALFVIAFAGPPFFPQVYWIVTLSVNLFLITNAVRLAAGLSITAIKTKAQTETNWLKRYQECIQENGSVDFAVTYDDVSHIIIIPNYKEEFETLCETLDTLANHACARTKYKVILAMEEGETDCDEKAGKLISIFGQRFFWLKHTVHPSGIPGEARGKSSNVAWSAVYYAQNWMVEGNERREIFTVMDADTHLTEKYFNCITYKYATSDADEQERSMFAPVLIFDRNSNAVPFMVRVADICWSIGLMSNFQLPIRFPCSVYSVSFLLARRVNYWDAGPEAIGEDFHMAMKCWTALQMKLILHPIYIPASCSNVQADTWLTSVYGRYQQSKRHLWGLLDFGYAIARLITHRCWTQNFWLSLLCLYILFEIFYQPMFGFYQMTGSLLFPQSISKFGQLVLDITFYIRVALIPSAIVVAVAYERYHYICCRYREAVLNKNQEMRKSESMIAEMESAQAGDSVPVTESYGDSKVAFRPWYAIIDWAALPFCLFVFYMLPAINAMFWQMFTNKLDYKVSLKPTTRTVNVDPLAHENDDGLIELSQVTTPSVCITPAPDMDFHKDTISVTSFSSAREGSPIDGVLNGVLEKRPSHLARDSGLEINDVVEVPLKD